MGYRSKKAARGLVVATLSLPAAPVAWAQAPKRAPPAKTAPLDPAARVQVEKNAKLAARAALAELPALSAHDRTIGSAEQRASDVDRLVELARRDDPALKSTWKTYLSRHRPTSAAAEAVALYVIRKAFVDHLPGVRDYAAKVRAHEKAKQALRETLNALGPARSLPAGKRVSIRVAKVRPVRTTNPGVTGTTGDSGWYTTRNAEGIAVSREIRALDRTAASKLYAATAGELKELERTSVQAMGSLFVRQVQNRLQQENRRFQLISNLLKQFRETQQAMVQNVRP